MCVCADFDSGVNELTKGISLKYSSNVSFSVRRMSCSNGCGCRQWVCRVACGPVEGN